MSLILASLLVVAATVAPAHPAPVADPARVAEQASYQAWMHGTEQALRASASPRDRALAALLRSLQAAPDPAADDRGALLRAAAQAAPDDALVQFLWAQASPGNSGCDDGHPCPERVAAAAHMQPDNAAAWVAVVDDAWQRKDTAAIDAALARMAQATGYDDQQGQLLMAWLDVYQRHPLPATAEVGAAGRSPSADAFNAAMSMAAVMLPSYQGLTQSCHREWQPQASAQRFVDCATIGRGMLAHADDLIGQMIGRALLRLSGQATAADVDAARVAQWQYAQWQQMQRSWDDATADAALMEDWQQAGNEVAVMRLQLTRAGIPLQPPAGWQMHDSHGRPVPPLGNPTPEARPASR